LIRQHLIDAHSQQILLSQLSVTNSTLERMRGLLGSAPLDNNSGLLINPCNSIHTWFMKYPIDIIFIDKQGVIKKIVQAIKPWRFAWCFGAVSTLELGAYNAQRLKLQKGQKIQCVDLFC